ncbi:TerC family protein [Blastochloris tepida]|uniref:Membrane protein n=1 Tax=Blastochloris tepida TaxID=2233851 RepID=A0A348FYA6_9HYPH|nr:TerC family protein [Blastochloris tepida]BBF92289.1 membrane protein [Blastochloris tepida]
MLEWIADPGAWAALVTLTVMEVVLGIDNIVFISVLVSRLPAEQAKRARQIGLSLALIFRIVLLMFLTWLIGLTDPLFTVFGKAVSWRDVILAAGGLFLLYKAVHEIHAEIEHDPEAVTKASAGTAFAFVIFQVIIIDIVFSVDSIITAIGMAENIEIMVLAVIIAVAVMYVASGPVSHFITEHPTTKMLALAFLLLIGVALVADGMGFHIPRGYIYFAMAFAAGVEVVNVLASKKRKRRQVGLVTAEGSDRPMQETGQ